ncbi:unnamed protein product [Camellia sinensis]
MQFLCKATHVSVQAAPVTILQTIMRKCIEEARAVPQGHDCCSQRHTRDGVEVWKMGEHEMDRGKNHDEVGQLD